jgi:hypothetical protein
MIATLADRIDWDRFPRTHWYSGSIPTQVEIMCRACGDPIEPPHWPDRPAGIVHVYGTTPPAPAVVMCDTCHASHAGGAR